MSLAHLATVGQLAYNGYEFDGSSRVTVRVEFVYDEAGRTVLYHRHTITVHFFVHDVADTDGDFLSIRALLSKPGKKLTFTGHGFGNDLIVNREDGGGLRDVKWGPTPRIINWTPVGSSKTCEAIWEVTACVPVCDTNGVHRTTGVMSVNYEAGFDIEKGFTTRTISGHLEIAQTRLPVGLNPPDCADLYRDLVNPAQIPGYERMTNWRVSLDKSRVEFTVTDRQIRSRNAWPNGVVHIRANHDVEWARDGRRSTTVRSRLSVDVELAPTASGVIAWNIFGNLVKQRTTLGGVSNKFLDGVSASEEIFGTSHNFAATWRELKHISDVFNFGSTGLWQPVPGTNWAQWQASMAAVFDNRGYAGLTQLPGNDLIIDLCSSGGATIPWNGADPNIPPTVNASPGTFQNQTPPADRSYFDYTNVFEVLSQRPVVRQTTMQTPDNPPNQVDMQGEAGANFGGPNQGQVADTLQQSGAGSFGLRMIGKGTRAGYAVPCPAVATIGGKVAVEVAKKFKTAQLGVFFGVPVFSAQWVVDYMVDGSPGEVSPLPSLQN